MLDSVLPTHLNDFLGYAFGVYRTIRMCLLAVYFRVAADAPVVIGANREEFYARGGEPPQRMDGACRILAGRDPRAGGTWLGVNEHGVIVAVTNRPKSAAPAEP